MKKVILLPVCLLLLVFSCDQLDKLTLPSIGNTESIPSTPEDLTLDAVSSATLEPSIEVSWVDSSDNEEKFTIERSTSEDFSESAAFEADAEKDHYLDKTIDKEMLYYYRLKAENSTGSSDWTEIKSITFSYPIPAVPTELTASKMSNASCRLRWIDNSYCEDGFRVEYSEDSNFNAALIKDIAADETGIVLSNLTSEGSYYIRVSAYNDSGLSGYSKVAAIDLSETLPLAPTGVMAEQYTNTSCIITWTDNSDNETGFRIDYSMDSDFSDRSTVSVNTDTETKTVFSLNADSTYYFRVCALNSAGSVYDSTEPVLTLQTKVPNTLDVVFSDGIEHGRQKVYTIWMEWDEWSEVQQTNVRRYKNIYVCDRIRLQDLTGTGLPYWQENIRSNTDNVDAVSGSTVYDGNFNVSASLSGMPDKIDVYFEIDHSNDVNDWFNDQPSILYEIHVDRTTSVTEFESEFIGWTANEYTDDESANGTNSVPGEPINIGVLQYTTGYILYKNDGDSTYNSHTPDDAPATDLVGGLIAALITE